MLYLIAFLGGLLVGWFTMAVMIVNACEESGYEDIQ